MRLFCIFQIIQPAHAEISENLFVIGSIPITINIMHPRWNKDFILAVVDNLCQLYTTFLVWKILVRYKVFHSIRFFRFEKPVKQKRSAKQTSIKQRLSSMFFIVVYSHMFRGLYYGSYMHPRQFLWCSGVLIFLLMMGTAFMGYVLPWGQMAFGGRNLIGRVFVLQTEGLGFESRCWTVYCWMGFGCVSK